ncbi:hypothetical protein GH714_036155 [Hevea brasiliensis]|uniref:Uncharacterized protein n=1 Tax=Hevea brasiliensis TaxID=3981 RepID=A0A6A6KN38_HEVBR|nr:hypothetical protein GH714_036155 [Hevea brasiliensis]
MKVPTPSEIQLLNTLAAMHGDETKSEWENPGQQRADALESLLELCARLLKQEKSTSLLLTAYSRQGKIKGKLRSKTQQMGMSRQLRWRGMEQKGQKRQGLKQLNGRSGRGLSSVGGQGCTHGGSDNEDSKGDLFHVHDKMKA